MAITDQPRLLGLAIAEFFRRLARRLRTIVMSIAGFSGFVPERLMIAPQDLRTADPTMAQEFYSGRYSFAGVTVQTRGENPFLTEHPDPAWESRLHDFRWLRHLTGSKDALASDQARAIVKDWIDANSKSRSDAAWEIEIASRRIIAWLNHSILIVSGADHEFYRVFMRSLGAHVRFLKKNAVIAPAGMPSLIARAALAYASVCLAGQKSALRGARGKLDQVLADQVFADGGHVSRNPEAIVEILALLLPLRQSCASVGVAPSQELVSTIERLMPALRFFRHGDGHLVRFNGAGVTESDLISTLLHYDESRGMPLNDASQSGYQRMTQGNTTLLMDTGNPPSGELSVDAHAGCLSFEFSDGRECLVVNCGTPPIQNRDTSPVWRSTAAHSTAVLNDTSSCKFNNTGAMGRYLRGQIFSSQINSISTREDTKSSCNVQASHHGYVRDFGVTHHRSLTLENSGHRLTGVDSFKDGRNQPLKHVTKDACALRFHFHPDVKLATTNSENAIAIETREGALWFFECFDAKPVAEESIFFATPSGARKSSQIAVYAKLTETPQINWVLRKTS